MQQLCTRIIAATLAAVLVSGCGASGNEGVGPTDEASPTTADRGGGDGSFGTLSGLCSEGDATIAADEAGRGTDKLYIGVATDRNAQIRPGLNKEMWDASIAFVEWCNEQGGIRGLQIEPVELDAAILEVERAMSTACRDVFAMVGGGMVQDNLQFSGKDGSDFHRCGLVDIPGYAVSPQKADSNGQVQPVPNSGTAVSTTWIRDYMELEPDAEGSVAIAYSDVPSLEIQKNKYEAALDDVGLELAGSFPYPVTGLPDWTPLARSIIDSGASTLMFVGEPGNLSNLLSKLREQGWEGTPLLETNMYDARIFGTGASAAEGALIRSYVYPFEEADERPATARYLGLLEQYAPGGAPSALGVLSMSAWLLFATAANACADANDGVISRNCLLEQAAEQSDWTGGGLHAPVDPAPAGEATAPTCSMLLVARNGAFERFYPKVGGTGDDGDGFSCRDDGVARVPANEGLGVVDPDRPI
jgi:ABC-type branched-subunit amino acid transport system substrate-binding protein